MLTRRSFLRRSVVVVSSGLALPPVFMNAAHVAAQHLGADSPLANRILVVVQMAGGNDGLNTVIPYGSGRYHDLRRGIGVLDADIVPLDGATGLHPSLVRLKELWDEGALAIVQGVGYPNPSLSHFRSMEIWQTADAEKSFGDGWLGKYFNHVIDEQGHLLDAVSVGSSLPLALRAPAANVAVVDRLENYRLQSDFGFPGGADARVEALLQLYARYPARAPYAALFHAVAPSAYRSTQELQRAAESYQPALPYPPTPLGTGLRLLAQTIHQGLGIKVFHIGMGGFDTHANQPGTQARLLQQLSEGLHAFYRDLQAHGKAQDVLVMTWSEFGRRATENANRGTDHGTAGPMFLLGGQVQGGFYGEAPSLTNLQNENLRFTVDFRSVYATLLDPWLGAPAEEVLGSSYERFPLLSGGSAQPIQTTLAAS